MSRPHVLFAAFVLSVLTTPGPASAGPQTYISLGDSVAFGETDFTHNPSYGDRGYVAPVADFLATRNNGVRPNVINLAIDAETSSTFFNGGAISSVYGTLAPLQNLNYTNLQTSQNALLLADIKGEHAAGHSIAAVSISLGINDVDNLASTPGFLNLTFDQQYAQFLQTLGAIQQNYSTLLTELKTLAPEAKLFLLGASNSDAEIPGDPFASLSGIAVGGFDSLIAQEAAAFGGSYVDLATPFTGHIADYTYAFTPPVGSNTHPNALGYSVIADQIIQAAVPEPESVVLLAIGVLGVFGLHRRSRPARFEV
jgi:lysophospholipase L1-like esterase